MASVDEWAWKFCKSCKAAKRAKPAGGTVCSCKAIAWRARWRTPEGASRSKVFDRKRDAEAAIAKVETDKNAGTYVDRSRGLTPFVDFAEEWAEAQAWKDSTRDGWPARLARLTAALGNGNPADGAKVSLKTAATKLRLQRARAYVTDAYAHATATADMHLLLGIIRAAAADERIPRDPANWDWNTYKPKRRADDATGEVTPDMVPTRTETYTILTHTPRTWRAGVALGSAGLRIGEVLGLAADRVDLDTRTVVIDRQATELRGRGAVLTTPKEEKTRTIKIPALVAVELRRHLNNMPSAGLLFPATDGGPMTSSRFRELAWYPTLKRARIAAALDQLAAPEREQLRAWASARGLPDDTAELTGRHVTQVHRWLTEHTTVHPATLMAFKFHALRHFCATNLLSEGASIAAVAGHLGDTIETVQKVYAHWSRDDIDVPVDILDRLWAPVVDQATPLAVAGNV